MPKQNNIIILFKIFGFFRTVTGTADDKDSTSELFLSKNM